MPRNDDDPVDDELDPEGPDPSEMDYSDEADLDVCPHCRKMIVEDAERCPHCGEYISSGDRPLPRGAWILIVLIALLMLAFLLTRL